MAKALTLLDRFLRETLGFRGALARDLALWERYSPHDEDAIITLRGKLRRIDAVIEQAETTGSVPEGWVPRGA